jgi:HAE1 family hydrophobic/amphiphilic exporter-1
MGTSSWFLRKMDALMDGLAEKYRHGLEWCLEHRTWVVIVSLAVFAGSILFLFTLRKELIPPQDQSLFLISLKTPAGTSIQATDAVYKKAEDYLRIQPEIKDLYTTIGNYQNNNVINAGVIYVILKEPKRRSLPQREIMDRSKTDLKKILPNVEVSTQDLSLTGFSASRGFPIEFTLEGPNWEKLIEYSKAINNRLEKTGLLEDLNTDYQVGMPEVQVIPNRANAARHGVSVTTIAQEVGRLIGGQIFNSNTQFPKDEHRYSIRVRSEPKSCEKPSDISSLLLGNDRGTAGTLVPLSKTAEVKVTTGSQLISRVNRSRAIPVFANVVHGQSQQAAMEAVIKVGKEVLPPNLGYELKVTGSAQAFEDAFEGLIFALILGVAVAYMVLASQFNSFIHPVTVLTALPFSLSGALIALFVTRQSLSLYSMIGLILLMGIVKKNSILLVDFTNQRRAAGLNPVHALLEACPVRLRPILMTSVATIAGAIPEALNFGAGAETRVPMAISLIGGVLLSTVLTLFVVPCVYSLLTRFERSDDELEA